MNRELFRPVAAVVERRVFQSTSDFPPASCVGRTAAGCGNTPTLTPSVFADLCKFSKARLDHGGVSLSKYAYISDTAMH